MIYASKIYAQVAAVNKAHAEANRLKPLLLAYFEPRVGQAILKSDGDLLLKLKRDLPEVSDGLMAYRGNSKYSLFWHVKADEAYANPTSPGYQIWEHYEVSVYVAELDGGVLRKLIKLNVEETLRDDYTVTELLAKRAMARALKDKYERAKEECWPFGSE